MAARFELWGREAVLAIELKGNRTEGGVEAWGRYRQPTDQIRRGLEHPVEPAVGVQRGVEGCRQGTGRLAKAILRELNRDPPPAIRLSQPLPDDSWGRPEARAVLPPAEEEKEVSAVRFAAALGCRWRHGCRRTGLGADADGVTSTWTPTVFRCWLPCGRCSVTARWRYDRSYAPLPNRSSHPIIPGILSKL